MRDLDSAVGRLDNILMSLYVIVAIMLIAIVLVSKWALRNVPHPDDSQGHEPHITSDRSWHSYRWYALKPGLCSVTNLAG
jgi:hypothetical protein